MTEKRLSELADMLATHIVWKRTDKALLIAQFLRKYHGYYTIANLNLKTGHRTLKSLKYR